MRILNIKNKTICTFFQNQIKYEKIQTCYVSRNESYLSDLKNMRVQLLNTFCQRARFSPHE